MSEEDSFEVASLKAEDALELAFKIIMTLKKFKGSAIGETVTLPDDPIKGVKIGKDRGDLQILWTPRKRG